MTSRDDIHIEVRKVPMLDTGLGQEAGYKDDAELLRVAEAERAALSPEVREVVDTIDAEMTRRWVAGE